MYALDFPDQNDMIACRISRHDRAAKTRQSGAKNRRRRGGVDHQISGDGVIGGAGEIISERLLFRTQHADAKEWARGEILEKIGVIAKTPQRQRRLERHRGERIDRQRNRAPHTIAGGGEAYAGGEPAKGLAQGALVQCGWRQSIIPFVEPALTQPRYGATKAGRSTLSPPARAKLGVMAGNQAIVIKKVKKGGGHGHHGGAWKVAYADFVTAMMAFFLLMWLINTTTPEQKRGIADYFAPASVSASTSGSGGILAGTELATDGVRSKGASTIVERTTPETQRPTQADSDGQDEGDTGAEPTRDSLEKAKALREEAALKKAEITLRQAIENLPDIAELSKHILIDQTPEGLRVQLVDQEGRSMFETGSAQPNARAQRLIAAVGEIIAPLTNRVSISGHTDASTTARGGYGNWELSSDRANATRRLLQATGLSEQRIHQVAGKADSEPLFVDDPTLPGNRRISIVLLREAPPLPEDHEL